MKQSIRGTPSGRMPGQRSPAKHDHGVQKPGSNGNNRINAQMLHRALTDPPDGFEYPR